MRIVPDITAGRMDSDSVSASFPVYGEI
jgi:hypothetical protein